ncbi:MAG TPA: hypothetical protein VFJ94_07010 [Intrasporangium sp.]|uniref:hypothetical protein n=1 Tax=Intrasporangium sp. TaxID=1925024 RepID=UPI002D77DA07|nr:hypothetical protein [Intrasporangium sp.]HET7398255.1 hypothetical protein [Intrasporangium sp.]
MTIAVVMDFEGASVEQYDEVIKKMNFTPGGPGAPGGLFHWVTAVDGGLHIVDVWETREQYEAFAQEQIGPLSAEAGIPGPPKLTFHDVYNYLTAGPGSGQQGGANQG